MQNLPDILYRGSVKNVRGHRGDQHFYFEFTDRYSIFDWGEMPDHLPQKGESLALMSYLLFQQIGTPDFWTTWRPDLQSALLQQWRLQGMRHHLQALVDENLLPITTSSYQQQQKSYLQVQAVDVFHPQLQKNAAGVEEWNYAAYSSARTHCLVPLEVIFRWGVPKGSSLLKRSQDQNYLQQLGLTHPPQEGERFAQPVLEFSTKLEPTDKILSYEKAQFIAGLSQQEWDKLRETTTLLAWRLKDFFALCGLELWDGKFEFAFIPSGNFSEKNGAILSRDFMLVDAIGPDELRLTTEQGVQVSKEIFRQYYMTSPWYESLVQAKEQAQRIRGGSDWKQMCLSQYPQGPGGMGPEEYKWGAQIYPAITNCVFQQLSGKRIFADCAPLDVVMAHWQQQMQMGKQQGEMH